MTAIATTLLEHLEWDSAHFGFPVARVAVSELSDDELLDALLAARASSIRLLYWTTAPGRGIPEAVLSRFGGIPVGGHVTYGADIESMVPSELCRANKFLEARQYPAGPASPDLLALAVSSGVYSRFRLDPSIPAGAFIRLYEAWGERSARRQLADVIFVVSARCEPDKLVGLVTVSVSDNTGRIGLLAADARFARQGIGTLLIASVHAWLTERDIPRVSVTTQPENRAACRFYERQSYAVQSLHDIYHFWPCEQVTECTR